MASAVEREAGPTAVSHELWDLASTRVSVVSDPAGATVTVRPFGHAGSPVTAGATPLEQVRVPRGAFHWRVELAGNRPADFVTGTPGPELRFDLRPEGRPMATWCACPAARSVCGRLAR